MPVVVLVVVPIIMPIVVPVIMTIIVPVVSSLLLIAAYIVTLNVLAFIVRTAVGIRGDILAAIHPAALPWMVVHENGMLTPSEANTSPTPWGERRSDGNSTTKVNRASHEEVTSRASINDVGIIERHIVDSGIDRQNLNHRALHVNALILVTAEIAILVRLLTHTLHSVHHLWPLH